MHIRINMHVYLNPWFNLVKRGFVELLLNAHVSGREMDTSRVKPKCGGGGHLSEKNLPLFSGAALKKFVNHSFNTVFQRKRKTEGLRDSKMS